MIKHRLTPCPTAPQVRGSGIEIKKRSMSYPRQQRPPPPVMSSVRSRSSVGGSVRRPVSQQRRPSAASSSYWGQVAWQDEEVKRKMFCDRRSRGLFFDEIFSGPRLGLSVVLVKESVGHVEGRRFIAVEATMTELKVKPTDELVAVNGRQIVDPDARAFHKIIAYLGKTRPLTLTFVEGSHRYEAFAAQEERKRMLSEDRRSRRANEFGPVLSGDKDPLGTIVLDGTDEVLAHVRSLVAAEKNAFVVVTDGSFTVDLATYEDTKRSYIAVQSGDFSGNELLLIGDEVLLPSLVHVQSRLSCGPQILTFLRPDVVESDTDASDEPNDGATAPSPDVSSPVMEHAPLVVVDSKVPLDDDDMPESLREAAAIALNRISAATFPAVAKAMPSELPTVHDQALTTNPQEVLPSPPPLTTRPKKDHRAASFIVIEDLRNVPSPPLPDTSGPSLDLLLLEKKKELPKEDDPSPPRPVDVSSDALLLEEEEKKKDPPKEEEEPPPLVPRPVEPIVAPKKKKKTTTTTTGLPTPPPPTSREDERRRSWEALEPQKLVEQRLSVFAARLRQQQSKKETEDEFWSAVHSRRGTATTGFESGLKYMVGVATKGLNGDEPVVVWTKPVCPPEKSTFEETMEEPGPPVEEIVTTEDPPDDLDDVEEDGMSEDDVPKFAEPSEATASVDSRSDDDDDDDDDEKMVVVVEPPPLAYATYEDDVDDLDKVDFAGIDDDDDDDVEARRLEDKSWFLEFVKCATCLGQDQLQSLAGDFDDNELREVSFDIYS